MWRAKVETFACWTVLTGLVAIAANAQNTTFLPHWSPDKTLVKRLNQVFKVERYSLQPPKNYQLRTAYTPEGMKEFAWAGEARRDGTQPTFFLGLLVPFTGDARKYTLEQLADKRAAIVKRRRTDWQQGKTEKGIVNGMTFARIRWTATEPTQQQKMQGFIYVARDGDTIVQLTSQDVLTQAQETLPIAETSALTFKKQ